MTQPATIFLGPDSNEGPNSSKVFLRTLLYSTSQRGQNIESLFVSLQRGETKQNFSIWVYGDEKLLRGSGLFVPQQGVAFNHHFLLPADVTGFTFQRGEYRLKVFAIQAGKFAPKLLATIPLHISESEALSLQEPNTGIYFDWGPDVGGYLSHIRQPQFVGNGFDDLVKLSKITENLLRLKDN